MKRPKPAAMGHSRINGVPPGALRLARCAPSARTEHIAERYGLSHFKLCGALRDLPVRGRCASLVNGLLFWTTAMVHRACPPGAQRSMPYALPGVSWTPAWRTSRDKDGPAVIATVAREAVAARSAWGWMQAVGGPAMPAVALARLSTDPAEEVRAAVAASTSIGSVEAWMLSTDPCSEVVCALAANPACPDPVLKILGSGPDPEIRAAAASNPALGVDALECFAVDEDTGVRAVVAAHQRCPPQRSDQIWVSLASGLDASGRAAAAAHGRCPWRLLDQLAGDDEREVRKAVAANPACPRSLVRRLCGDSNNEVASAARNR